MPTPAHPPARWSLPDHPSLDLLRKRAKRLRDAVAERRPEALDLVADYDPPAPDGPIPLARAQRVLARAFGFAGWSRLREHLATVEAWSRPMQPESAGDGTVDRFLRLVCLSYTRHAPDDLERAATTLREDPALATGNAFTMAACGRAVELAELLGDDPGAVTADGGPHRWPPLLYLCYSRLGLAAAELAGDPVATMRVLLDAGADPNAGFLWQGLPSPFTALTGVLGGGERAEPPHPQSIELAELLLAAGADPNDNQALYNRMFTADDSHLPPLLRHGLGTDRPSPWRERLGSAYPSPREMVGDQLGFAAEHGFTERVRLLLEHGVEPTRRGSHPMLRDRAPHLIALRNGHLATAELLAAAGGTEAEVPEPDLLVGDALAGRAEPVRRRLAGDPDLAGRAVGSRPDALAVAAERHGLDAVRLLVEIGFPVSGHGRNGRTALHEAALRGDVELCRWLVQRGADRTLEDREFGSTPAGWAAFAGHQALAHELAPEAPEVRPG